MVLPNKSCRTCKQIKPLSDINKRARSKDGHNNECRQCQSDYCKRNLPAYAARMRKWVAAHPEQYATHSLRSRRKVRGQVNAPTRPQPSICECCGEPPTARGMFEDHNHQTGLFRGWLCHHCNSGLGLFKDSPQRLAQATAYLERNK